MNVLRENGFFIFRHCLKKLFNDHGLKVISLYGNYEKQKLDVNSRRIILIGRKIKNNPK